MHDHRAAMAWLDLAVTYRVWVFTAMPSARCTALRRSPSPPGWTRLTSPILRSIRLAVALDHKGDTDACIGILSDVLSCVGPADCGPVPVALPGLCHGQARRAGHPKLLDSLPLLWSDVSPFGEAVELRTLGEPVCLAADGQYAKALSQLEEAKVFAGHGRPRCRDCGPSPFPRPAITTPHTVPSKR